MEQTLTFKRDVQGWQSRYDEKLVVASHNLCYHLNRQGSVSEYTLLVELEKMLGDFYLAH